MMMVLRLAPWFRSVTTVACCALLQVGRLWTALADFHIRRGAFEVARDVYEEGMSAVATVRDFGLIFDALSHFEESLLAAKLAAAGEEGEGGCACLSTQQSY